MKSWLEKKAIEMYSTHNDGKSVVAERFFRTLKTKIYQYMTSISKNVYIDELDEIVNKYNNTYSIIKMKPVDVYTSTCIDSNKEVNDEDPKFKIDDIAKTTKCKNIFAKGYVPNCSEEIFVIKKLKNTVPWTYVIINLKGEEIVGMFYEKELRKANQKGFRVGKLIKRKRDNMLNAKDTIIHIIAG